MNLIHPMSLGATVDAVDEALFFQQIAELILAQT
jgi:hypothetical protein